jgi:hypothetical protein
VTGASHRRRLVLPRLAATPAILVAFLVAFFGAALAPHPSIAAPARDESPRAYCSRVGDDDELRLSPPSLTSAIKRLFNLKGNNLPTAGYFRCAEGHVLVCWVGANIPCGKANTRGSCPPPPNGARRIPTPILFRWS